MKLRYLMIIVLISLSWSCNDDFLDRFPMRDISPQVFFNSENDLILYTNSFYENLIGANLVLEDFSSDNVDVSALDELVIGTRRTPTSASSAGWSWSELYNINFFLDNNIKSTVPIKIRNKYDAVAKFFRAFFYFEKVKRFGDVPWYSHALTDGSPELYKARDSRVLIVDSIIADLDYAIEYLSSSKDVAEVNKWTALALKSRICLFEGTYRKYHEDLGMADLANNLLEQAVSASLEVINSGKYFIYNTGNPDSDYLDLFALQTANDDEYILAKLYEKSVNMSHAINNIFTSPTRGNPGLTKSLIDSYLRDNGKPFSTIPNYKELPFWEETKNRDARLYQTIRTPGYRRIDQDPATPSLIPDYANALTGYQNVKFVSTMDQDAAAYTPIPIIRYAEVLLNFAEAKAELGTITQNDIDISIKRLRDRVGMPNLNLSDAQANPDAFLIDQYRNVSSANKGVILEIRRERRVELILEGFRYYDLMRWKEGHLLAETFEGVYFPEKGEFDLDGDGINDIAIVDSKPDTVTPDLYYYVLNPDKKLSKGSRGNIIVHPNIDKNFDEEKDYLFPLPINELLLNKELKQNPGWKER